jgi:hypothetical protein
VGSPTWKIGRKLDHLVRWLVLPLKHALSFSQEIFGSGFKMERFSLIQILIITFSSDSEGKIIPYNPSQLIETTNKIH